jgi:hypothetical protein
MSGYVRIHRTLIGHPVFRNDAEAMVFAWLITQAQWKRTRVRYRDHIIQLERGQLAISLRDLAFRFDRDKAWIGRLLKRLENEAMIETASETGVTVITLCNYNEYQSDPVLCETPRETPCETGVRQGRDTEQEREKGKKGNTPRKRGNSDLSGKPKRAVSVQVPEWMPVEQWLAFVAMRERMEREGKPRVIWSEDAAKGVIAKIDRLRGQGHCPAQLLEKAVVSSWRTVFADEDTKARIAKTAKPMTRDEMLNAIRFHRDRGDDARAEQIESQLRERAA